MRSKGPAAEIARPANQAKLGVCQKLRKADDGNPMEGDPSGGVRPAVGKDMDLEPGVGGNPFGELGGESLRPAHQSWTRMRSWCIPVAAVLLSCSMGCGGTSPAVSGAPPGGGGEGDARAADGRGLAAVELSHVSQFEPSSTTYTVRPDGSFDLVGTGQDFNYVGHTVFQPPLPADVVNDLFERVAEVAADAELVNPVQAYQPPAAALAADEVVVVLADGSRRMAATAADVGALLEAVEPVQRVLFERTRIPDGSQAEPTPEGWTQLSIELPGPPATELLPAVPTFSAVLVSDGQWSCTTFLGTTPAEGGRTVFDTRLASGRVDVEAARDLLRTVLESVHPSTGRRSTERADATVRMFHVNLGWGTPTAEGERAVLLAWAANTGAKSLDPACAIPE